MKILLFFLIVLLSGCNYADYLPDPTPTPEVLEPVYHVCAVVVANDCANLRALPSTASSETILTCVERGRNVWVSKNQQDVNGWSYAEVPGTNYIGFIWDALLEYPPGMIC